MHDLYPDPAVWLQSAVTWTGQICLIVSDWFAGPRSRLYTAVYWPKSHLRFPCNHQLGKQQHGLGTRRCLGEGRGSILTEGKRWGEASFRALSGRCELIQGGWYLQDTEISGGSWKLLSEYFLACFSTKKPSDFEGASSRASAPPAARAAALCSI